MANEIQINATLRYSKTGASASLSTSFFADQVGDKYESGIQTIGTAEESLQKGDIGTIGWLAIRNLDATNFLELGSTTAQYSTIIPAGKGCVTTWGHTGTFVKANTAAVNAEYLLIEA